MHRFAKMEIAAISRPKPGEDVNGDAYLVERGNAENGKEKVLIVVVEALSKNLVIFKLFIYCTRRFHRFCTR